MCGIAGFIKYDNKEELAHLANEIQKHRGPDSQSTWNDDLIALAHQRLSIIDLHSRSDQPLVKGDLVIVYNGEIYNYKELKDEHLKDVSFKTDSDTEVLLEMYLKYGEKCLDYFVGMFAFAIYNCETNELFAARDHFGIKPFFFTKTDNGFAFASELKTLINVPGFDKNINMKTLIESINYLWVPGNDTMFNNCFKLPPAHYLKIDKNLNYSISKYWDLKEDVQNLDEAYHIENLRNHMIDTIDRHMVADVPISTFLSGGLDSSLISVMALKHNLNLSTYTIATEKKDKKIESMPEDEKHARILADKFGFDHNEIVIKADILEKLPQMVRTLDEPVGDPAAINTYLICQAARDKGVKVLLSGMGADEMFFGYRRMKATIMAQKYRRLPMIVKRPIKFVVNNLPVKAFGKGMRLVRWAKKFLSFANLSIDEAYRMSYSYYDPKDLKSLFQNKHDKLVENIKDEHSALFNSKFKGDYFNQMCYTDINMFMVGLNLTYSDRASMAASVEVRVPFIDKLLITEAFKVPGKLKYLRNESKNILKKVAEGYLPREIIYRPKASFGAPIRSWISNDLKVMVDDLLSETNIMKRGFFNYSIIKELIENDRKGLEDNAYRIYQLLTVELWMREYID